MKHMPGETYRTSVPVPKPSFRERIKEWYKIHSNTIKLIFGVTSVFIIVGFIVGMSWLIEGPRYKAESVAKKTLTNNGYYGILKIVSSRTYWQAGSGCFNKDYFVGAACTHSNGKQYEVSMCCNTETCKIFKITEF
jgi:hypothetical protein